MDVLVMLGANQVIADTAEGKLWHQAEALCIDCALRMRMLR